MFRVRQELDLRRHERGDEFCRLRQRLNAEQGVFVDEVMRDVTAGRVRARYVDVLPGCGKTFMLRVLVLGLRSPSSGRPYIILADASTGVAASQYLGGFSAPDTDANTANRRFRITVRAS